jgi:hypothetical protein
MGLFKINPLESPLRSVVISMISHKPIWSGLRLMRINSVLVLHSDVDPPVECGSLAAVL